MASRGLEGFTPEMRRLLERAGIDLSGGMAAGGASGAVWGRDLAPSRQEAATAPWYVLERQTGTAPEGWLTDPGNAAVAQANRSKKPLDPTVQKLLDQVNKARAIEQQQGRPDTQQKPSFLLRALDYIGRPGAAVMGGITETARSAIREDAKDGPETGPAALREIFGGLGLRAGRSTPGDVGRGMQRGITATERYHGSKLLDEAGVDNRAARAVAGFGLDVAVDPLSYVTFGAAKTVSTGGRAAAAARQTALRKGADEAVAAGARMPADELVKHLGATKSRRPITDQAIDTAVTDVGRAAATAARSSLTNDLVRVGMPAAKAKTAGARWLNPSLKLAGPEATERAAWLGRLRADPAAARPYLDESAASIAGEASAATRAQLTALADTHAAAEARRMLSVNVAGFRVAQAPVPAPLSRAAARAGQFPAAQRALSAFDKTFNTGSRFDRGLTAMKARTAGLAERRIDAVRTSLVNGFRGVNADQRKALQEAIVAGPAGGWGTGMAKLADGTDAAEIVRETYDHVGRYVDWTGTGAGLVRVEDLNRFLPKRYKFDKLTPGDAGGDTPADMLAGLVRRNPHLRTEDPAQHLYALHIAVEKAVARDQLARGVASFGIPVSAAGRDILGPDGKMVAATSKAAQELREKHGWSEIVTKGRDKELGASYGKHLEGMIFDPATKHGITRLLAVADDVTKRGEILRLYDRSLSSLKKVLTLPSPAFHIRNSFGDVFLGYLDDVSGPRGLRSYEQASRTMLAIRRLAQPGSKLRETLDAAVDPVTGQATDPIQALAAAVKAGRREPGPGARVMSTPKSWPDAPGGYLSAEQLWAAYNHAGLKRGFVSADLDEGLRPGVLPGRPVGRASDALQGLAEQREDYFRLAHMIDRVKRSKAATFSEAAEEAAHYVRKFHFDYHDVTPTEQAVFARLFPFYKFQRFAAPLMVQMFFAKPGKIVNAQRFLYSAADANGYERDDLGLPTADEVLPEYFRDSAMVPLYDSIRGNTVFMNPGLPSTSITAQTLGLAADTPGGVGGGIGQNLVGSVNPIVQAPFELATGRRVFGGGDIPVGPLPEYVAGKTPVTNLAFTGSGKDDADTRFGSFLTGLGLSENTPSRQRGALLDEIKKIGEQRKKAGYVPAKTGRGRPQRSDSRGG